VTYSVSFANRAEKDLARLDRKNQQRIRDRSRDLEVNPYDPRVSAPLTAKGGLRKSRVGGWRMIFTVDNETRLVYVLTIERRGQVYNRL